MLPLTLRKWTQMQTKICSLITWKGWTKRAARWQWVKIQQLLKKENTKPKPKAGMPTGKTKTEPGERPDKPDKHKRYYQQKKAWWGMIRHRWITIPRETEKKTTTEGKLYEEKKPLKWTGSNQINDKCILKCIYYFLDLPDTSWITKWRLFHAGIGKKFKNWRVQCTSLTSWYKMALTKIVRGPCAQMIKRAGTSEPLGASQVLSWLH